MKKSPTKLKIGTIVGKKMVKSIKKRKDSLCGSYKKKLKNAKVRNKDVSEN